MRNLNFIPNILSHVFIPLNFVPVLFSMCTNCTSGIVVEGVLKKVTINAMRRLSMAPVL